MRYSELDEDSVMSSWISDLNYQNGDVIMTLRNGRSFRIQNFPENLFKNWLSAASKGGFWHSSVRDLYRTSRIR